MNAEIVLPAEFHIASLSASSDCWSKKQTRVLAQILGVDAATMPDANVPRNCLRVTLIAEIPQLPGHEIIGRRDFSYGRWPKNEEAREERARIVQGCLGYTIGDMLQKARGYLPKPTAALVIPMPKRGGKRWKFAAGCRGGDETAKGDDDGESTDE